MALTFTWRRTIPDTHYDFVAEEAGQHVGRIMRNSGGPKAGTWFWTCTGCRRGEAELKPFNGERPTRDEAIEALKAAWGRARISSRRASQRPASGFTPSAPGTGSRPRRRSRG